MSYYLVEKFGAGVDTRKDRETAPPGTFRDITNAHINPGGEIEKRKAFDKGFDLAAGLHATEFEDSFGLAALDNILYCFKDAASPDSTPPAAWEWPEAGVGASFSGQILRLQALSGSEYSLSTPGALALDTLVDWDIFDGKLYVVAKGGSAGDPEHFYDGARVTAGKGTYIRTFKSKMYSVDDTKIYFSTVLDPTDWTTTASGAGSIESLAISSSTGALKGLEIYYDRLAVFSTDGVQIWFMDVDPALNTLIQVIRATSLAGIATPRQFGDGDVMFLAPNGIRSLNARDSSNAGSVSDVGSPIDREMNDKLVDEYDAYVNTSRTLLDSNTGRYWLSFGDEIWVLSYFPGPKVTGWSRYVPSYDNTNLAVEEMVTCRNQPCLRTGDNAIYVYGGTDGKTYDNTLAEITFPYLNFGKPAHEKTMYAADLFCTGTWDLEINTNADFNEDFLPVLTTTGSTTDKGRASFNAIASHIALKCKSTSAERAVIGSVSVHYDLADAD